MKKLYSLLLISCYLFTINAQQMVLVQDLNPGEDDGFFYQSHQGAYLGNSYIFSAISKDFGRELFKLENGSITLIKDLFSSGNAEISEFSVHNGKVYFAAYADGHTNRVLWETDGTEAGTKVVGIPSAATFDLNYFFRPDGSIILKGKTNFDLVTPGNPQGVLVDGTEIGNFYEFVEFQSGVVSLYYSSGRYELWHITNVAEKLGSWEVMDARTPFLMSQITGGILFANTFGFGSNAKGGVMFIDTSDYSLIQWSDLELQPYSYSPDHSSVYYKNEFGVYYFDGSDPAGVKVWNSGADLSDSEDWIHAPTSNGLVFRGDEKKIVYTDGTKENTKVISEADRRYFNEIKSKEDVVFWAENTSNNYTPVLKMFDGTSDEATELYVSDTRANQIFNYIPFCYLDEKFYFISEFAGSGVGTELYYLDLTSETTEIPTDQASLKIFDNHLSIIDDSITEYILNFYNSAGALLTRSSLKSNETMELPSFSGVVIVKGYGVNGKTVSGMYVGR